MRAIYIHIPYCRSRCSYCTFTSSCDYGNVDSYIDALCDNIICDTTAVDSVFVGGGTPSTLTVAHFDKIFATLYTRHNITADAEITVECNPDSITQALMRCLVGHGVNRISIGLQSTNDSTLATIGRRHDYATFLQALDIVHDSGVGNVNVDIMVGLPESYDSFVSTVNTVCSLDITHISMYALELYQDSILAGMIASGKCCGVADDDAQAQWYEDAMSILSSNGFARYEVSNFAKGNHQCRHNLHYWQCDEYYGYGQSAHGYIDNVRYSNTCNAEQYIAGDILSSRQYIDRQEAMQEYIMLGLRLDSGVSISAFEQIFGIALLQQYPNISRLVSGGQLCMKGDRLYVPTTFTYVLTAILGQIL